MEMISWNSSYNFADSYSFFFKSSSEDMLIDFRERVREGEKEGEKHQCETETLTGSLSHAPRLGTKPATQAGALTRN